MAENQDYLPIHVADVSFDPLRETAREADADGSESTSHVIVQLAAPLTREERARLQGEYGLRLDEYLPEQAYVETLDGATVARLTADPAVRAAVPYRPEFKVSRQIGERVFRTTERQQVRGLWLEAVLFPDTDPVGVARVLSELGATEVTVLDDRALGGPTRVRFIIESTDALEDVLHLDEVRWVDHVPEIKLDNGTTAGTVQSGTPATTPVWAQGLHGEGQIIGVLDTVVDLGHCFFQDNVDNTVRPAHRKVVGLRNAGGAANGTHGTFVAGIAVGDDFNNPGTHANRGNAWAARITFGSTGDLDTNSVLSYLQAAAADGAAIHTNSWHDEPTPQYSQIAADVDTFVWNNEDNLVLGLVRQRRRVDRPARHGQERPLRLGHPARSQRDELRRRQQRTDPRRTAKAGDHGSRLRDHLGPGEHTPARSRWTRSSTACDHDLRDKLGHASGGGVRGAGAPVLHRGLLPDRHAAAPPRLHSVGRPAQGDAAQLHPRHDRHRRLSRANQEGWGLDPAGQRPRLSGHPAQPAGVGHAQRRRPPHRGDPHASRRRGHQRPGAQGDAGLERPARPPPAAPPRS